MFTGTLVAIFTAPAAGGPMEAHAGIQALAGRGLAGDRYAAEVDPHGRGPGKARHVTLIEEETVEALRRDHGMEVAPMVLRRNLLTRGVPLGHLLGRRFRVGGVLLEGVEMAEPCRYLEGLVGMAVREPLVHRGGIRAAILEGGELRVGEGITPVGE